MTRKLLSMDGASVARPGQARPSRLSHSSWQIFRPLITTSGSLLAAVLLWHVLSTYFFNPRLVPPPLSVLKTAVPMLETGELFSHAAISLWRVAVGFSTGCVTAIVLGVLMGRLRILNEALEPIIEVLRYLSPTAMIPIAIIWFGIGELSKYFLIFWSTFFFVLINTIAGVIRTPIVRQRAAQCLGASQIQIFLLVVLPSAVPYIVTGMRVAMASAFMAIIPAEMLAANSGIGYLLQQSGVLMQTNRIFVALAVICILGFVTDRAFQWLINVTMARYLMKPAGV